MEAPGNRLLAKHNVKVAQKPFQTRGHIFLNPGIFLKGPTINIQFAIKLMKLERSLTLKLIYNLPSTKFAALPRSLIAVAIPNFTITIIHVSGVDLNNSCHD